MSRVCQTQMKKLLDLLSEDGVLINGKVMYTNTNKQNFWKRIAIQLNSVDGGVYKNTWKWCKIVMNLFTSNLLMWADWKNKTKKKANILLRRQNYSMEHPTPTLTNLELRLLQMINYPVDDRLDALRLEMVVNKMEAMENNDKLQVEFFNSNFQDLPVPEQSSTDDDRTLDSYDKGKSKFSEVEDGLQGEHKLKGTELSDKEHKVKMKGKLFKKKKKLPIEEYKIRATLKLEKERVQQKSEELRLRALELKLKGDELKLKEMEMNKINYLTNIEEEKLKCFRDMSSSLKEFYIIARLLQKEGYVFREYVCMMSISLVQPTAYTA